MQVRRYVGRNMTDAVAQVRADFGSDAVILQTRRIREPGIWGLLGRRRVEVLAALENPPRRRSGPPDRSRAGEGASRPARAQGAAAAWRDKLIAAGLVPAEAEAVVRAARLAAKGASRGEDEAERWKGQLVRQLAARMSTVEPWQVDAPPCYHALIGPTGVGKTTTLAKLAANYALVLNKRVGLIAADTYRIGAVDQLREYAGLIGAPFEVVYDTASMRGAVERMADLDLVLIDTMGTSHRDGERLGHLEDLLSAAPGAERHLVLSATTRLPDLQDAVARFSALRPATVIVTKVDETTCPVTVFNATRVAQRPLSFVTTGQSVPEDIEAPQPMAIAEAIVARLV